MLLVATYVSEVDAKKTAQVCCANCAVPNMLCQMCCAKGAVPSVLCQVCCVVVCGCFFLLG